MHRLVLQAFVGAAPEGHECLHKDGDHSNNTLRNLRWGTRQENGHDQIRHGRSTKGTRNAHAKLSDSQVQAILGDARTHKEIAKDFKVSRSLVSGIKRRERWAHIKASKFLDL